MKFCILDMYHMHMSDFEIRPKDTYFYVAHTSHFRGQNLQMQVDKDRKALGIFDFANSR